MQIELLCVGKIKEVFYRNLIQEMENCLKKRCAFSVCQLPDLAIPKNAGDKEVKRIKAAEGAELLRHISESDYVIALCIEGKELNSGQHKTVIQKAVQSGYDKITFIIGGSLGLSKEVTDRADYKLSFSKMTFPHQLMRVMLMEELTNVLSYL